MYTFVNLLKYFYVASIVSICGILCNVYCWLVIVTLVFYITLEFLSDKYLNKKIKKRLLKKIIIRKINKIISKEIRNARLRTRIDDSG